MIPCANGCQMLCFLVVVLMVTLLMGHRWPTAAASTSKVATSVSKVAPSTSKIPATTFTKSAVSAAENDTVVVGSLVHLTKATPSSADLLPAGSKKFIDDFFNKNKFAKQGFKKSHNSKDADGYTKHDTFHVRDGDGFGYTQNFEFDKKGGDKHGDDYHVSRTFDDDDAAGSMPKFSKWHFEKKSSNPFKSHHFENMNDDHSFDELVGPDFEETEGSASRRSKRKKEPHPSATEYDNYEYADVEEPDDGAPADFEADEGDPEYGALYADAYDYY